MIELPSEDEYAAALDAAQQRIIDHPGYKEKQLCDGLARTVYAVVVPNRDDLLALLDRAASDANLAVELFQNVRRPVVRTRFARRPADFPRISLEGRASSQVGYISWSKTCLTEPIRAAEMRS